MCTPCISPSSSPSSESMRPRSGVGGCSSSDTYLLKVTWFRGDVARYRNTAVTTAARKNKARMGIITASTTVALLEGAGPEGGPGGGPNGWMFTTAAADTNDAIPSALDTLAVMLLVRNATAATAAADAGPTDTAAVELLVM